MPKRETKQQRIEREYREALTRLLLALGRGKAGKGR